MCVLFKWCNMTCVTAPTLPCRHDTCRIKSLTWGTHDCLHDIVITLFYDLHSSWCSMVLFQVYQTLKSLKKIPQTPQPQNSITIPNKSRFPFCWIHKMVFFWCNKTLVWKCLLARIVYIIGRMKEWYVPTENTLKDMFLTVNMNDHYDVYRPLN